MFAVVHSLFHVGLTSFLPVAGTGPFAIGLPDSGLGMAAGLFALEHNVSRLAEDHARAEALAAHLRALELGPVSHATNMVFLTPRDGLDLTRLGDHGVRVSAPEPAMRLVMHRSLDDDAFNTVKEAFSALM